MGLNPSLIIKNLGKSLQEAGIKSYPVKHLLANIFINVHFPCSCKTNYFIISFRW